MSLATGNKIWITEENSNDFFFWSERKVIFSKWNIELHCANCISNNMSHIKWQFKMRNKMTETAKSGSKAGKWLVDRNRLELESLNLLILMISWIIPDFVPSDRFWPAIQTLITTCSVSYWNLVNFGNFAQILKLRGLRPYAWVFYFENHSIWWLWCGKDVEFSCASFDICHKFVWGCPPTHTPTQKFKNQFSIFSSQKTGAS